MILLIFHSIMGIIGLVLFAIYCQKERKERVWEWIVYSSLVAIISSIFGIVYYFFPFLPSVLLLISTATGVFFALFVLKQIQYPQYFGVKDIAAITLSQGKISVIHEMKPLNSLKFYEKELVGGKEGLCITRENKEQIKLSHPALTGTTLWLSAETGADVNPTDLEEVSYIMNDFIAKHKDKSVILLDGFTFLVNYHDFMKVMHLFQILKDKVSKENAIILMPIEEKMLEAGQVKIVNTEFEVV